jgi:hypothetical protein
VQEGTGPELLEDDPEKTINTVCHTCNNGWMSQLEQKNIPRLKPMLLNCPIALDPGGLKLLAEWAAKTAMVSDSVKVRNNNENFYTRDERFAMRTKRVIPARTRIWIGALADSHLGCHGTDVNIFGLTTSLERTLLGVGSASTIYAGHFVVQVFTEHYLPRYASLTIPPPSPKPGISDSKLIGIYPAVPRSVAWPPSPFTSKGPESIAYLMDRWRVGERLDRIKL